MSHDLVQVRIIHLSDIHFGDRFRFQPAVSPNGSRPPARGYPSLATSIQQDLASAEFSGNVWTSPKAPLIVALTGDLTQNADTNEFAQATSLLDELTRGGALGRDLKKQDIFVVPGNHDVVFTQPDPGRRWFPFCEFYEHHTGFHVPPAEAYRLTRVIDRSGDVRLIAAEINTCFDVRQGSAEEKRGHVDSEAISVLRKQMEAIPPEQRERSIKIALMHHHPVVLPALAEPNRGYDAIANAQLLLGLLRDYRFHLLLHGHKHYPHTFSYDSLCAWTTDPLHPMMVVAGGSAGSTELPEGRSPCNTYNLIAFKWNADARHGRVRVVTRGLERFDGQGKEMEPERWIWRTLRTDDRNIAVSSGVPTSGTATSRPYDPPVDDKFEDARVAEYGRLRGNMLVCEVEPSLDSEQAYEVHLWLVAHTGGQTAHPRELPIKVEWAAGKPPNFLRVKTSSQADGENFAAGFAYWGPMLVQARLHFEDGSTETATIYARLPQGL